MSMAVFKGYSSILRHDRRLESATNKFPNWYFGTVLGRAHWERAQQVV
ncbi:hypothetical protein [Streptomyces echinatus]